MSSAEAPSERSASGATLPADAAADYGDVAELTTFQSERPLRGTKSVCM